MSDFKLFTSCVLMIGLILTVEAVKAEDIYLPDCKSLIIQNDCQSITDHGPRFRLRK